MDTFVTNSVHVPTVITHRDLDDSGNIIKYCEDY